jgi:hypothetical protein
MPYYGTCPYCKRGMDYPNRTELCKCVRCLQVSQAPPRSKTWRGDWFWPTLIGGGIGAALGWWLLPGLEESLILAAIFAVITLLLVNLRHFAAVRRRFGQGVEYVGTGGAFLVVGVVMVLLYALPFVGLWFLFTGSGSGGGSGGVVVPVPRFRGR